MQSPGRALPSSPGAQPFLFARRRERAVPALGLLFILCLCIPARADTARLSGIIFTIAADHLQTLWPNARVTLKHLTSRRELSTVSNDLGEYSFVGLLSGDYELTVTLDGFETVTKPVSLKSDAPNALDIQLTPQYHSESVTVSANPTGIDTTSSSGGTQTLTTNTLKSLIRLNSDFQEALPLLPGVLRGPDGLIRIKGGNANQSSALINNASIGDPFTGQPALRLPAAAVDSIRVLSNPFSSEFGGFSSGVIEVTTRGGGDEWKWLFEDPIPRFRWIDYRIHGVESATPHLAFSGPLVKNKLFLFQSLYYGYDTIRTPSLPNPNNIRIDERTNTQTQLDWDINSSHRLTGIFTFDPANTQHANIDTFNPEPVTADDQERGFFTSVADRWILKSGGFLQSLFSAKQLNFHVFPADSAPGVMTLYPEQNSGSFFESQRRFTWLYQWTQALHLRPLTLSSANGLGLGGRHLFTFGYNFSRSTYDGTISNLPLNVLREDHTLAERITYALPSLSSNIAKNNVGIFLQDNWQLHPRFTLDLGLRFEHDSLSAESLNTAPRIGFVFAPTKDNRTAVRGGIGLFYDKIPLNVAIFPSFPAQTITTFAADGVTVTRPAATYAHVIATSNGTLRLPYSLGASLQFDRQLRPNLLLRLGYEHRTGYREFFVNPLNPSSGNLSVPCVFALSFSSFCGVPPRQTAGDSQLQLLNSGHQTYDEFLAMLRWNPTERTSIVGSYVRSYARGELNDYNQFFANFPYPLIRPNQYGPLPSDAPNRVLFWGIIQLPHRLQFVPVLDAHSGFPYSNVDANWNYLDRRNEAGRFPGFASLDLKLQYPFDFKFKGHRIQFLGGLKVINVTNHYNPRDIQQNVTSPSYGLFYNSVGRLWRIDGDFDF